MFNNDIEPGMFVPPRCKRCGKMLKRRGTCGFWDAFEEILAKITNPFSRQLYACKGKVYNRKYDDWKADCKKIGEKNKQIRKMNRIAGLFGKQKPEIPYPPQPPRKIPCPNHYLLICEGKYNQRFVRRRKKIFYDNSGNIYYI